VDQFRTLENIIAMKLINREWVVNNLKSILMRVFGIICIVSAGLLLPTGCVLIFLHKQNTTLIGGVFIAASILNMALAYIFSKFAPRALKY